MSMNDTYQPINCDDYDNLELACQHHLILTLELKDGEVLKAKASDLLSRKNVEYGRGRCRCDARAASGQNSQLQPPANRHRRGERILMTLTGSRAAVTLSATRSWHPLLSTPLP